MHSLISFPPSVLFLRVLPILAALALCAGCGRSDADAPSGKGSKKIITLTKDNWEAEVTKSTQPVMVDFWASWCGPCKAIAPTVAALSEEFDGRAKVGKVDVDAQPSLAEKYKIEGIPAILFFKDGKKVDQIIGLVEKSELKEKLDAVVKSKN